MPMTEPSGGADHITVDRDYIKSLRDECRAWRRAYRKAVDALCMATGAAFTELDRQFRATILKAPNDRPACTCAHP